MATTAQTKSTPKVTEQLSKMADFPHEMAMATFQAALQTQETSHKMMLDALNLGFTSQEASARAAKDFVGTLFAIQHDLVKKSAELTEKAFSGVPTFLN
ncbi:MAG: hypothetical protein K1Y36_15265 [Blastocatellia bacterium]|nr:hypothetical protein [Blastocatellia bacterium]